MAATTEAVAPHQFDEINAPVPVLNPDNSLTTKIPYMIYIVFHHKNLPDNTSKSEDFGKVTCKLFSQTLFYKLNCLY